MSHQRLIDQSEFALSLVSRLSGYVMLFFVFFFTGSSDDVTTIK